LRIWLVCFYFGFSFVTLSLSLSGGVLATCAMGVAWHLLGKRNLIGTIGLAVLGAMFHNLGQLMTVFFLLTYNVYLFYQVPVMIVASIVFGMLIGILTPLLAHLTNGASEIMGDSVILMPREHSIPRSHSAISLAMLVLSIALVFVGNPFILLVIALLISSSVQVILGGSVQALFFPIKRFWLLFLFVACLLLFLPYGKRVAWAPWFTQEGMIATVKQWLRLWTWLQISFIFTYFRFHALIFRALDFFFRSHKSTLYSGLLAVEDFPGIFDLMRKRITMEFRPMVRHPISTSKRVFQRAFYDVADYIISRHSRSAKERDDSQ
jgi:hypothetical protein